MLINYVPSAKTIETTSTLCQQSIFLWINGGLLFFFLPLGGGMEGKGFYRIFTHGLCLQNQNTNFTPDFWLSLLKVVNLLKIQFIFILLYPFTVTGNGTELGKQNTLLFIPTTFFFSRLLKKRIRIGFLLSKWRMLSCI